MNKVINKNIDFNYLKNKVNNIGTFLIITFSACITSLCLYADYIRNTYVTNNIIEFIFYISSANALLYFLLKRIESKVENATHKELKITNILLNVLSVFLCAFLIFILFNLISLIGF